MKLKRWWPSSAVWRSKTQTRFVSCRERRLTKAFFFADGKRGSMEHATILVVSLIGMTIILIAVIVFRPEVTATRGGKMLAFLVLFALPILCMGWAELRNCTIR